MLQIQLSQETSSSEPFLSDYEVLLHSWSVVHLRRLLARTTTQTHPKQET